MHREKGSCLSVYVDDIKFAGKEENTNPIWKVLNKEVDWGESTSFLDHVYFGCTQRHCETRKHYVDKYRTMFQSRISAGATEKLPSWEHPYISTWSSDIEDHAKKCVERYCELANKTTGQLCKVSTPCIDDHHLKNEELKSVGELSDVCSQIAMQCLYLARIGTPDILWSVNKLARAITKWIRACEKRSARLISYIHCTSEYKQYCHVGNTAPLTEGVGRSRSSPGSLRAGCQGDAEATCLAQTQETLEVRVSEGPLSRRRGTNCTSLTGFADKVEAVLEDQAAREQVLKYSEKEARFCHPDIVVASLGAQRKDKPNGEVSARGPLRRNSWPRS